MSFNSTEPIFQHTIKKLVHDYAEIKYLEQKIFELSEKLNDIEEDYQIAKDYQIATKHLTTDVIIIELGNRLYSQISKGTKK